MAAFRAIVFSAVLAGLIAGLLVTALQHLGTVPLILKAEVFERQAEQASAAQAGHQHAGATAGHDHAPAAAQDHGTPAWEPAEGFQRNAFTALFNVIDWIGFGLLLNGATVLLRRPATWREGLLWGLGAFVAFVIAPGLGLPPELPGSAAGPLVHRQVWWVATVIATAVGLGLIALLRSPVAAVAGILLIAAPHLVGAPHPADADSIIPAALAHQFVVAATLTALPAWALLGGLSGFFFGRFSAQA